MTFFTIFMQCEMLYDDTWDEEMDKVLLGALIEQRSAGNFKPLSPHNYNALLTARGSLNGLYSSEIGWEDVVTRLAALRKRYDTFKFVIEYDKVWYYPSYNKVRAERTTWKKIWHTNEFAKAYVHEGEPEWVNLEKLFEPLQSGPAATEVIVISDGSVPQDKKQEGSRTILVPDDDNEVVSPMFNDRTGARKKLFDEIYPSKFQLYDVDETKTVGSFVHPTEVGVRFPPRNAFPPRPRLLSGGPSKNAGSSSCSSSSPVKWFHFGDGEK